MERFKDASDREWTLTVTVKTVKAIRDELNIDITKMFEPSETMNVIGDPVTFVNVLFIVCREQATVRGLNDEKFGEALYDGGDGDVVETARECLIREMLRFFPKARQEMVRATLAKAKELQDVTSDLILKRISGIDVQLLKASIASQA